jgi:hypothetical protein
MSQGTNLAYYDYVSNGEISPENFGMRLKGRPYQGRVHINGAGSFSDFPPYPTFLETYSQSEGQFLNIAPGQYSDYFIGGVLLAHALMGFDYSADIVMMQELCLPAHRWAATLDSLPLTTIIRFDGPLYHAAQYAEAQVAGGDTLWQVPWTTQSLPGPAEPQLIWVEGVARIKGVVAGRVTVLASDSLFIMGDLITVDTDTLHHTDPALFGTSPSGSPHRIGLVGEKDVIIAATLENGFADGANSPQTTCGLANRPVLWGSGHDRRDVVIQASILALGCTFTTEFWKTTVWGVTPPQPFAQYYKCGGINYQEVTIWDTVPGGTNPDCFGTSSLSDRRGTLWYHGSLMVNSPGYHERASIGLWYPATIGYQVQNIRYDANLRTSAPPFWPDVYWQCGVEPLLSTGAHSGCGLTLPAEDFQSDWDSGAISLLFSAVGEWWMDSLAVRTWINGELVSREVLPLLNGGPPFTWTPTLDLSPWLDEPCTIHLDAVWTDWVRTTDLIWIPLRPDAPFWNDGGQLCSWTVQPTAQLTPVAPAVIALSEAWPNPFNPTTRVELSLPAPEAVRLEVFDVAGRRVALIHDGPLPAGSHAFTIDGAGWAAGLHLLVVKHRGGTETRKLLLLK